MSAGCSAVIPNTDTSGDVGGITTFEGCVFAPLVVLIVVEGSDQFDTYEVAVTLVVAGSIVVGGCAGSDVATGCFVVGGFLQPSLNCAASHGSIVIGGFGLVTGGSVMQSTGFETVQLDVSLYTFIKSFTFDGAFPSAEIPMPLITGLSFWVRIFTIFIPFLKLNLRSNFTHI